MRVLAIAALQRQPFVRLEIQRHYGALDPLSGLGRCCSAVNDARHGLGSDAIEAVTSRMVALTLEVGPECRADIDVPF